LWKAFVYARDLQVDRWEFSLRLTHLVELGVAESDLRRLVFGGYVDHADERTTPDDPVRRFRPRANLAFTGRTCFLLSEKGALVACPESEAAARPSGRSSNSPAIISLHRPLPSRDGELRVLLFDGCVVKRFRVPAPNQEAVLSTFEEEGWPTSIDDPLPYVRQRRPKQRLHATIHCLNANQESRLLRFRGDGTGEAVLWEPLAGSANDRREVMLPLRRTA
jgi:hypothetical protein